ncbi:MAG: hypothetical protein GY710_23460 [Desulfobacteraceae bacterium]|nr:hypothetical protein [Desulfobacteraceae bacterium]
MLIKNVLGTFILLFNMAGLGYLLYLGIMAILEKLSPREKIQEKIPPPPAKETSTALENHIIPDEDDLLKDMDLSDLDNLNLDDFE